MTTTDDVLHLMAEMDERDQEVVADLVHLFAVGDRTRIDAVQDAIDAGDVERVRQLVSA